MTKEKSLIKLSIEEWNHEQCVAIARVAAQALTESAPILGETWSSHLWEDIIKYLKVTQKELEERVVSFQEAAALLSNEQRDIRIEVMVDLVALALQVNNDIERKKEPVMIYDARSRRFLIEMERKLNLSRGDLSSVERSISQQIYYALLENQEKEEKKDKPSMQENMDSSAKKSIFDSNKKKDTLKWIATGAGILGGGAIIGNADLKED